VLRSTTGGTDLDNPSFRWTRTSVTPGDPPNTLRPLLCEPATPVTLSSTAVG
jgi:dehydratase